MKCPAQGSPPLRAPWPLARPALPYPALHSSPCPAQHSTAQHSSPCPLPCPALPCPALPCCPRLTCNPPPAPWRAALATMHRKGLSGVGVVEREGGPLLGNLSLSDLRGLTPDR